MLWTIIVGMVMNKLRSFFRETVVNDDICNHEYRLGALTIDAIFREARLIMHKWKNFVCCNNERHHIC